MKKTILLGSMIFLTLTSISSAKSSRADFHQSCRSGAIATFKMSKGVVYADFNGKNRKRFECKSGLCTQSHSIGGMKGLSVHRVTGTSQQLKRHSVKCR